MLQKIKKYTIKCLSAVLASAIVCPISTTFAVHDEHSIQLLQKCTRSRQKFICENILRLSTAAVNRQLISEIQRYKNRAPDIFEISEELIDQSDKRTLLIILSTLNYLFEKYKPFTDKLIDFKRSRCGDDRKFILNFTDLDRTKKLFAFTPPDLSSITFNDVSDYHESPLHAQFIRQEGAAAECKPEEAIAYLTTHEFGHLLSFICYVDKYGYEVVPHKPAEICRNMNDFANDTRMHALMLELLDTNTREKIHQILKQCREENAPALEKILKALANDETLTKDDYPDTENFKHLGIMLKKYYDFVDEERLYMALVKFMEFGWKKEGLSDEEVHKYSRLTILCLANIDDNIFLEKWHESFEQWVQSNQRMKTFYEKYPDYMGALKTHSSKVSDYMLRLKDTVIKENDSAQCHIGNYANKDPYEYIAEAFAALECIEPKKAPKSATVLGKFLQEKAHPAKK